MASQNPGNRDEPDIVALLFGPPRSGKSATGNLILGSKVFFNDKTKNCVAAERNVAENDGKKIRIVDTNPTSDYSLETENILHDNRQITRSLLLAPTGHRNIILVVKIDQRPKEVAGSVQFLQILLGKDKLNDLIIVFTGTGEVNDTAFGTFLNKLNNHPDVKTILNRCKENRIAFNDGNSKENQTKVKKLLQMMKKTDNYSKELQLVLIGQSWAGKSKVANNILGEDIFMYGNETHGCTAAQRDVNGKNVLVVDTPGFFSKVKSNDTILSEFKDPSICLAAPSRMFALVMRMDRDELSEEEKKLITILEEQFHDKIADKLVIVFTRQEEYLRKGKSFEEFLRSAPPALKSLLNQCHYRCLGFNNMAINGGGSLENTKQVSILLKLVEKTDSKDTKLRFVLIGLTGVGKSSTGNTILGIPDTFKHATGMTSVTTRCEWTHNTVDGRLVEIVDTPGLFDTRPEQTSAVTLLEMARCLTVTVPGPHAFFLVIAIADRFTLQQQQCIDIIRMTFGEQIFRIWKSVLKELKAKRKWHTVVIFTKTDHLNPNQTIEEVIQESGEGLKKVLRQNNNRWLAFNNSNPSGNEPGDVIEAVELMLACNEGRHYTSTMYRQIATRLRAYGAGNFAEMRTVVDKHPWAILSIVSILTGVEVFGFGMVYGIITFVVVFLTLLYETIIGRGVANN